MKLRKRITRVVVLGAALSLFAMPVTPASAGAGAASVTGIAHLAGGLSSPGSTGCFGGVAAGVAADPSVAAGSSATATFAYANPTTVEGTADGTLTVNATVGAAHSLDFHWERIGVVAVVTGELIGVAAFAPVDLTPAVGHGPLACAGGHPSGGAHAALTGAGLIVAHN